MRSRLQFLAVLTLTVTIAATFSAISLYAQVSGISARAFPQQVTVSRLPTANGSQGVRIVTDALSDASCSIGGGSVKLICFDNGAWVVVGLGVEGSQGEQGPQGEQGIQGEIGPQGIQGLTGLTGPQGIQGVQGAQGIQGPAGVDGIDGSDGIDGTNGLNGTNGSNGSDGATGPQGPIGLTGPAGPVAGSNTQLVFNDSGSAAGDPGLTFNKTTDALSVSGPASISGIVSLGSLTSSFPAIKSGVDRNGALAIRATRGDDAGATSFVGASLQLGTSSATSTTDSTLFADSSRSEWTFGSQWLLGWTNVTSNIFANADVSVTRAAAKRLSLNAGRSPDGLGELVSGKSIATAQVVTIADNGNGATQATSTLTPITSYALITCNDTNGCDVAISETGAADGQILRIVCASANICGFVDTSGVNEMAGVLGSFDMGQYDVLSFAYSVDRWVETGRSDN